MSVSMLAKWMKEQQLKGPSMKEAPVFYRNLEEELDKRRADQGFNSLKSRNGIIDFSSNDILSLSSSGILRQAFLEELARHPNFPTGSTGSRLLDGNNSYIEKAEKEIAEFHSAESALLVGSGYEANSAVFAAIPRAGDAIMYDELVHASMNSGIQHALPSCKLSFEHNDVNSFREVLSKVIETQPQIRNGKRTVLVAIESTYSMDGDISPAGDFIQISKELLPQGNFAFIYDEAHSTGIVGPRGAGMAVYQGLQDEIAIRVMTYGKAMGSHGAVILAKKTVKDMVLNFAKGVVFSTAPSFPMVACIKAGYNLMKSGVAEERQEQVQKNLRLFLSEITSNPVWEKANQEGILSIPVSKGWEAKELLTHVIPIWTRPRYNKYLVFHLSLAKYGAWPIDFPVVPMGTARIRLAFHAGNTESEVKGLVSTICAWAQEMLDIEASGESGEKIPKAARRLYMYSSLRGNQDSTVPKETKEPKVSVLSVQDPEEVKVAGVQAIAA